LEFSDLIVKLLPTYTLEFLAALTGIYYLNKVGSNKITRRFAIFLWIIFSVEIFGLYPALGYYTDYEYLSFIEGTWYVSNYWLYNPFLIFSFSFYIYYFRSYIDDKFWRQLIKYLTIAYIFMSIFNLFVSDVFLEGYSQFTTIGGTLILIFTIIIFYFELLKSDVLLKLKYFLPLYISVGAFIFYLCITPVDIFSRYFGGQNQFFVQFRLNIYQYLNVFLYSTYILGFIVCSRKKKSY